MKNDIRYLLMLFGLMVFIISGCAKKVPPLLDIQNAKIALEKAKDADAPKLASDSFKLARKYYEDIKTHMDEKDFKKAKYSAQKALIEARLSQSRAENAKVQKQIDKLSGEVSTIKKEFATILE